MTSDKGGVAFTFDLDITCEKSEIMKIMKIAEKLKEYEDLEEQGKLLKNPQELKDSILDEMKEFMDEYRSNSKSSIDYFGGKADTMATAMRIVKVAFLRAERKL